MCKKRLVLKCFTALLLVTLLGCVDAAPTFDNVAATRCSDGIQNFDETGIDYGGKSCNRVCTPYTNEIKAECLIEMYHAALYGGSPAAAMLRFLTSL